MAERSSHVHRPICKNRKKGRGLDRGPKRAARRAERARLHNIEHGRGDSSDSSCLLAQAASGLFSAGPWACMNSIIASMYNMGVNRRSELYLQEVASGNTAFSEKRFMDSLIKELPDGQQTFFKVVDDVPRCVVCGKKATERHVASQAHIVKIEEEALTNILGCDVRAVRHFDNDLCVGVATKKLILDFWGHAIQQLPAAVKRIHSEKGVFYIDGKLDRPLNPRCCMYELGVVTFSAGSKHRVSTYISWRDLPDLEETAEETQMKRVSPACQGWWPVVALRRIQTTACGWQVLFVCCYQLFSDGPVSASWIWCDYTEAPWVQASEDDGVGRNLFG